MPLRARREASRPRPTRRVALVVAAALLLVAALPPVSGAVLWRLALLADGWMEPLHGRPLAGRSALDRVTRKTLGTAEQYRLVASLRAAHPAAPALDDVARMVHYLVPLRRTVIAQWQVPHTPPSVAMALAGLGWCDQLNGLAAMTLAPDFGTVQIVGVIDPAGAHSFGRVWSARRGAWLYFDVWGDEVTVFALDAARRPAYLARVPASLGMRLPPTTQPVLDRIYDQAGRAFVHNAYPASFAGYMALKWRSALRQTFGGGETAAPVSGDAVEVAAVRRAEAPPPPRADSGDVREYLLARRSHFAGDTAAARAHYCAFTADARRRDTVLGVGARTLLGQLGDDPECGRPRAAGA